MRGLCVGVCVCVCVSLQIKKGTHNAKKYSFITSGRFHLYRSDRNDCQGLICAYLDQIIASHFIIYEFTSILQNPYHSGDLTAAD